MNQVIQGDCLEVMQTLPDNSIDLICVDPPYFKVKSNADSEFNWWDNQWDKPIEFLKWIDQLAEQWQRLLRPNGSLYCFASHRMSARVEVQLSDRFNVLTRITWQKPPFTTKAEMAIKENLRSYFPSSESIIFCEQDQEIFRMYLDQERENAGATLEQCNIACGHSANGGMAGRHYFRPSQFIFPTEENYHKLQKAFPGYFLRLYESLRRPFNVTADVPYTDVWSFPTVKAYPGKHPCEKPADLLEHIISASSLPNAVVLDCFAGSGSTLLAAKKLERQYIGIEIDPHWVSRCNQRLGDFTAPHVSLEQRLQWLETQVQAQSRKLKTIDKQQLSLFDLIDTNAAT